MNKFDFAFFHVGDTFYPTLLTKSIKKFNPDSKIFYITDKKNKNINTLLNDFKDTYKQGINIKYPTMYNLIYRIYNFEYNIYEYIIKNETIYSFDNILKQINIIYIQAYKNNSI